MYKQYPFYVILTLICFSCGNNTSSKNDLFVQPKVLEKNGMLLNICLLKKKNMTA